MKTTHIAAIVCFAVALLFYFAAGSEVGGGGFAFLGFIFEMMAWKKTFEPTERKK